MIEKFDGKYSFLSNYYETKITYDGITYENNEAAFHAQKTLNIKEREEFSSLSPRDAKRKGRKLKMREDWEEIKTKIMYEINLAKFTQNEELKKRLLKTGNEELVEGNYWHDNCWGNCTCEKCKDIEGENRLGKILMNIREELQNA